MNKKIFSSILAGVVLLSTQATTFSAMAQTKTDSLVDLTPSHWAYNAVKMMVEDLGIMEPKSATRFNGNDQVTRYEAASAFYNIAKNLNKVLEKI